MAMEPQGSIDLLDYLQIVRRRRWLIVATSAVMTLSALFGSLFQSKVYQSTARLLVQPSTAESVFDSATGGRSDQDRLVSTEIEVLKSEPIRAEVARILGGTAPGVFARPIGRTDVVLVSSQSTNPARAAVAANAYASAYIDYRRKAAVEGLLQAGQDIQVKIAQLQNEIDQLDQQARVADESAARDIRTQRDVRVQQQASFRQRLDLIDVEASLRSGGAQIVSRAAVPSVPISPKPLRAAVLALVVGSIVGLGLALLWDFLDDTIKSRADVEAATGGLTILGLIPFVESWRDRKKPMVVSVVEPSSETAEAYRSLRTAVQFLSLEEPMRILQVTSAGAGEGKSSMVSNLGITLAKAGQRVVLVDCDLRRPRLMNFFDLNNEVGLTSVILGRTRLQDAVQLIPGQDHLYVLTAGPRPPNPSELLSNQRTFEVLAALKEQADIVIIDSPPVLPVTDATILGARVDGTILLTAMGTTTKRGLARAHELLAQVGATLIGVVLNGATSEDRYGYGYGAKYGYGYGYGSRYVPDDEGSSRRAS